LEKLVQQKRWALFFEINISSKGLEKVWKGIGVIV
jgi:hypothetical protein